MRHMARLLWISIRSIQDLEIKGGGMMGYFCNKKQISEYKYKFCYKCSRYGEDIGCPVLILHVIFKNDIWENENSLLNNMIPLDEEGENMECLFFV